jgi:HD-GYP domain-containing protein (c-di-GMP phosphodiesterase class II)
VVVDDERLARHRDAATQPFAETKAEVDELAEEPGAGPQPELTAVRFEQVDEGVFGADEVAGALGDRLEQLLQIEPLDQSQRSLVEHGELCALTRMQRAVGPAAAKQPHEWRIGAASGALKRRLVVPIRTSVKDRLVPTLAAAAVLACVPPAVLHFVGRQKVYFGGGIHFGVVAVGAAAAVAAAVALLFVGARRHDGRAVLVGGAFSVMAALLCLHGATTPGVLVGDNGVVAFTGGATLPVGGALLALGALPILARPSSVRPMLVAFAVLVAGIVGLGVVAALEPSLVPPVPEPRSPLAWTVLAAGLACYGLLAVRALRTYLLTRRLSDLLVAVGIVWLAAALAAALLLNYLNLGWWLGHAFEVVGIFIIGVPVALDLLRGAQSRPLTGDLRAAELVGAEEAFLGSHVRALTVALATKDTYTEEHTRRVAMLAVRVGEELGLPRSRLRALAVGALLHDVGKLAVPDEVLKKPGPLDDAEFVLVQEHPMRGRRLLRELGGFGHDVLRLVLDHHERRDGSGYPRGLCAKEIDFDTSILAVCDVYDALRSERVYREAWTHDQAITFLRDGSGTLFDERCVGALERLLARDRNADLAVAV